MDNFLQDLIHLRAQILTPVQDLFTHAQNNGSHKDKLLLSTLFKEIIATFIANFRIFNA